MAGWRYLNNFGDCFACTWLKVGLRYVDTQTSSKWTCTPEQHRLEKGAQVLEVRGTAVHLDQHILLLCKAGETHLSCLQSELGQGVKQHCFVPCTHTLKILAAAAVWPAPFIPQPLLMAQPYLAQHARVFFQNHKIATIWVWCKY